MQDDQVPDPTNPWGHFASFHIQRSARAMALTMAIELEAFDLRPSEATILCMIDRNPGISQASISKMIATRRPNISPITRELHRRGLIERGTLVGRNLGWSVTEPGKITSQRINAIVRRNERQMLDALPPAMREGFMEALRSCGVSFLDRLRKLKPHISLTLE